MIFDENHCFISQPFEEDYCLISQSYDKDHSFISRLSDENRTLFQDRLTKIVVYFGIIRGNL